MKFEKLEVSPFPEQASPTLYEKGPQVWHDRCLPKYHALLKVLESAVVHPSTNARIAEILLRKLKLALRPSSALAPEEAHFIVGHGFSAFVRMTKGAGRLDRSLEPLLRAAAPRYCRLPSFLEAMFQYVSNLDNSTATVPRPIKADPGVAPHMDEETDTLISSLILNLTSESHDLRLLSLQLFSYLFEASRGSVSEALSTMLLIEQTPLDLQTARSASMHIRKLAAMYGRLASDPWLSKAIPYFCFGMLTVKFAQIWEDASASIKQIAEVKVGEEAITQLAFDWLVSPSQSWDGSSRAMEEQRNAGMTDFECSNLMKLDALAKEVELEIATAQSIMLKGFEEEQKPVSQRPAVARTQALRALSGVPHIAEKRSRQIIPMFLSWALREGGTVETTEDIGSGDTSTAPTEMNAWSRRDQKGLLDLICLFTNPKVLYKAEDVYTALLKLMANGDLEIQKSAMKAILTWKSPSIRPYEESLSNLLDEARFKEEIALLLQGDTKIQPEHRQVLMPVLLRLLYGRTIARKGAASGKQGMEARRLTVLRNLSVEDVGAFLDIALGDLQEIQLVDQNHLRQSIFQEELLSVRKQVGFVHMMEDVLKELATKVLPFTKKLLEAVLYCTISSSRQLQRESAPDVEDDDESVSQTSMLKVIRQTGFRCLILLFTNAEEFNWTPYVGPILDELIKTRIEKMPIETGQGVSGLLQLLSVWSLSAKTVLLLGRDDRILSKIAECLEPPKSKDSVKLFALSIINNVVKVANAEEPSGDAALASVVKTELLQKHMDTFLTHIGGVLRTQQDLSKDLLEACVDTVSQLAPFVEGSTQAQNLVDVSVYLLDQPSRRVSPKTKSGLLLILQHFVPLYNLQDDAKLRDRVYNTVTSLFGYFKDRVSREVLSKVLLVYSRNDPVLVEIAALCVDFNSFSDTRLDEPDYDRRLTAFTAVKKTRDVPFTAHQWRPVLYNMLYYIKHDEEFGILSSNSSDCICSFVDSAAASSSESFMTMLSSILIPSIYAGAREPSEVIRREYLKVMAHLVRSFPTWTEVSDMHGLLGGEDELESSFFNNVLATGKGRQSGALVQLAAAAERGELGSKNLSHFFIPVIEHFILDREEGNDAHNLAAETTTTVGVLVRSLEWPQYRALLRRYIGYIQARPELEKQLIRLVGKVIDALALAVEKPEIAVDADAMAIDSSHVKENTATGVLCTLAQTMPKEGKLADDLTSNILPPLTRYVHDKDETTVSLRVPVAVIIVRLLKLLPRDQLYERLPAVLTDICHILRSKAQEARDMTRDTLAKICVILGPSCFGFVLKELRGALARGSQLHVLSYTMHSILVAVIPDYAPGDLDYCLPQIVAIIMDDIFGATGQEKDAEEYTSKMKEVKSSKSHDSMELIAKTATLSRLTDLVRPIQVLLQEKVNLRMVRKIDELLNRISTGLLQNSAARSRDSLVFCYEVIQDVYKTEKVKVSKKVDYKLKRYLIQKGAKKSDRGSTTIYTYKLVRFALDVMRAVLKKYDNLRTSANLAGFLPILGDAVVQAEEEIKVAAFKMLATVVKVPLKVDDSGANLYKVAVAEATRSIAASSTTTSDISQAALKLISVVLRERREIPVKESAIDILLQRLREDMTDPEKRHVTFNFLRAILDSKVETATVYDTLDYTGTVMVTNEDNNTRDLARGAYFQFLREYPQKKSRWSKQLAFIVANLKYDREGGRLSILEVIHLLLSKSSNDFVQEVSATCFVPLIFVLVNDESEKCRMAAGEVIKEIFNKADKERMQTFLTLLRSWTRQTGNSAVMRLAFQTYGFYYEVQTTQGEADVPALQSAILDVLENGSADQEDTDWELIYAALQLAAVLCQAFPELMLAKSTAPLWLSVRSCLTYPHAWVKLSGARLCAILFADFARTNAETGLEGLPLRGSAGLKLDGGSISELILRTTGMFKTPGLTELLANEIVKNLMFLGRCAGANDLSWRSTQKVEALELDDEEDNAAIAQADQKTALQFLFGRLSFILRRETSPPRAPGLIPKTAALQLIQILTSKLSPETLTPILQTILLPLHNLTDPSIPTPYSTDDLFKANYETLKSSSQEIMSNLQTKCGTAVYTAQLLKVREGVRARRNQRTTKRRIEAVSAPEKFGRDKKKKVERKKERRKERGMEHRDQRQGF